MYNYNLLIFGEFPSTGQGNILCGHRELAIFDCYIRSFPFDKVPSTAVAVLGTADRNQRASYGHFGILFMFNGIGYLNRAIRMIAVLNIVRNISHRVFIGDLAPCSGQDDVTIHDFNGFTSRLCVVLPASECVGKAVLFNRRHRGRQNRCALSRDICSGIFIILIFRSLTRNYISHSVGGRHGFRRITHHGLKRRFFFLVRVAAQASLVGGCIIGGISVFTSPPGCASRIRLDGDGNNQLGTSVGNFVSICVLCNCIGRIVKADHFQLLARYSNHSIIIILSFLPRVSAGFIHAAHFGGLYSDFRSTFRSHAVKREILGQCIGKDCLCIGLDFQLGNFLNDLLEHIVEGIAVLCRQVVIGCRAVEILCDFPRLTTNQPMAGFFNTDFGCTCEIAGQEIQETVCGCNIKPANRLTATSNPCFHVCIAQYSPTLPLQGLSFTPARSNLSPCSCAGFAPLKIPTV